MKHFTPSGITASKAVWPIVFLDVDDVAAVSRESTGCHKISALKVEDFEYPELWTGLFSADARAHLADTASTSNASAVYAYLK